MGAYAQCWLDDIFIGSSKNDIDPNLLSLFRSRDKIIVTSPFHNLPSHLQGYGEGEDDDFKVVYYETSIEVVRDRLDLLGYNLEAAEDAFQQWVKEEHASVLERHADAIERLKMKEPVATDEGRNLHELMEEDYRSDAAILAKLTPREWVEGLKFIRSSKLQTSYYGKHEGPYKNTTVGYMLENEWLGFPGYDRLVPLRLAIESCDSKGKFIYDVTDLVSSQYFDASDDFVAIGIGLSEADYSSMAKTVILTEGKTDAWILQEALGLLYPHLQDYFSFLDFESSGFGGGVGNLVNVVKAFAGSGIVNNIVALFDNDTAATAACRSIQAVPLPSNLAIRKLPPIALLNSYPTIGPSGPAPLNVNGIAASIELYLGEDVLRGDDGKLVPVQWTGYEKLVGQYQGEVLDKAGLHERFRVKLARAQSPLGKEWDDLREVLKVLFSAFAVQTKSAICARPADYYRSQRD